MKLHSIIGLFALLTVLLCVSTAVYAQTEEDPQLINFEFPEELQAGSNATFAFSSTKPFTKGQEFTVGWENPDAEPFRTTNCRLLEREGTSSSLYPSNLQVALNFGPLYCYMANQTLHYGKLEADDRIKQEMQGHFVANIVDNAAFSPDNCDKDNRPLFKIKFEQDIPEATVINCDFVVATTRLVPARSKIVPHTSSSIKFYSDTPSIVTIVPTKAYVMSTRPHPTDPWAFLATFNSTRTGSVGLTTVSTVFPTVSQQQFSFDTARYSSGSDGSFWCYGIDKRKDEKLARVVPRSTWRIADDVIVIYFHEANVPVECLFKIQPRYIGFQIAQPTVNLRLHQQPLVAAFNITEAHIPFKLQHTFQTDSSNFDNILTSKNGLRPQVIISFPIGPGYAKDSLFFVKLSALEGTQVAPEDFTSLVEITKDEGNLTPEITVDAADPSRFRIAYKGEISDSWQYLGLVLTMKEPQTEPTRLRYQVDITDAVGTLLNPAVEQHMEIDMITRPYIDSGVFTFKDSNHFDFDIKWTPTWVNSAPNTVLRLAPRSAYWFNGTETCTAENLATNKQLTTTPNRVRGDLFLTIAEEIPLGEQVNVKCTMQTDLPIIYSEDAGAFSFEVGLIPANFVIPQQYLPYTRPSILEPVIQYTRLPGSILLDQVDVLVEKSIPTPAPFQLSTTATSQDIDANDANDDDDYTIDPVYKYQPLFDPLQDSEEEPGPKKPSWDDPQGFSFSGFGLRFITVVPWPSDATLVTHLKPAVDRVLSVITRLVDEEGKAHLSDVTFDSVHFQTWGQGRAGPAFDLTDTFLDSESPFDYSRSLVEFQWVVAMPDIDNPRALLTILRDKALEQLALAVEDGTLEKYDVLSHETSSVKYVENGPTLPHCKGPASFGKVGCTAKLPGQQCTVNVECSSFSCTNDKVCSTWTRMNRWNAYTRPEALGAWSQNNFEYLTSGANYISFGAVVFVVIGALFF